MSKAVSTAVLDRLSAWTHLPVSTANVTVSGSDAGYLEVQYPITNEEQISVGSPGNNVFRESGVIRFVMSIPKGQSISPYDDWFEELRDLFRAADFGGVTTWSASPATTDDRNDQGSFYRLSCAVPFQFDRYA